jgi:hypothetical protein
VLDIDLLATFRGRVKENMGCKVFTLLSLFILYMLPPLGLSRGNVPAPNHYEGFLPSSTFWPDTDHIQAFSSSWWKDPLNMRVVGQFGGNVSRVAVHETLAYVGIGLHLHVLDVSDPNNPTEVGRLGPLSSGADQVSDITIVGQHAYVLSGYGGLHIIDVIIPSAPVEVGFYDHNFSFMYAVAVSGHYAYLIAECIFIVVDVEIPAQPTMAATYLLECDAYDLKITGNYAFLGSGWSGVTVLDISDPANPMQAAIIDETDGPVLSFDVLGDHLFVGEGLYNCAGGVCGGALHILDVIDFDNPVRVGYVKLVGSTPYSGQPYLVRATPQYAYLNQGSKLQILDVSNPSTPISLVLYDTPGTVRDIEIVSNRVYLADELAFRVINIADPTTPAELSTFEETPTRPARISVLENYAYIADNYWKRSSLQIFDVSDPSAPVELGTFQTSGWVRDVAVLGQYAYLVGDGSGGAGVMQVLDVTNPAAISETGRLESLMQPVSIALEEDKAYVVYRDGLHVIDTADKSDPRSVGFLSLMDPHSVTLSNSFAIIADGHFGLKIIDVTIPSAPSITGFIDTPFLASHVAISGTLVYLTEQCPGFPCVDGGLRIIDIADPENPSEIGFLDLGPTIFVSVVGTRAYVGGYNRALGVHVVNVALPATPSVAGYYPAVCCDNSNDLKVAGGYIYAAGFTTGLYILSFDEGYRNYLPLVLRAP